MTKKDKEPNIVLVMALTLAFAVAAIVAGAIFENLEEGLCEDRGGVRLDTTCVDRSAVLP